MKKVMIIGGVGISALVLLVLLTFALRTKSKNTMHSILPTVVPTSTVINVDTPTVYPRFASPTDTIDTHSFNDDSPRPDANLQKYLDTLQTINNAGDKLVT